MTPREALANEASRAELQRGLREIDEAKLKRDAALGTYRNNPTAANWTLVLGAVDEVKRAESEMNSRVEIIDLCRLSAAFGDNMQSELNEAARDAAPESQPLTAEPDFDQIEAQAQQTQAKLDAAAEALEKATVEAEAAASEFESKPSAKTHSASAIANQIRLNAERAMAAARAEAAPIQEALTRARLVRKCAELEAALNENPIPAMVAELEQLTREHAKASSERLEAIETELRSRAVNASRLEASAGKLGIAFDVGRIDDPDHSLSQIRQRLARGSQ